MPAASYSGRPPRQPGLTITGTSYRIPDPIRRKFREGWKEHVPLTFLTDDACRFTGSSASKAVRELYTVDETSGRVITTSKPLADDGELQLPFDEWHQAWRRLLNLIREYLPEEFGAWETHYRTIRDKENRSRQWKLWLAYDIEIRRRATYFPFDVSIIQNEILNDLEPEYLVNRVISIQENNSYRRNQSSSSTTTNTSRPQPYHNHYTNARESRSELKSYSNSSFCPANSERSTTRCIICGDNN